ncbi:NAD(P)-dependent glycerol-3-phosphate dehydrogenase [Methylonatrum kenyense]|uniref:NAD(P)H-dependent glycerol-3-phosphate dehydrogenase n=1 Tax=Methylonatrum kenyense TaxID=455253 RepID=UPI0020BDF5D4|nr:NAD(P)H-dependent glycerol-3-phosphate dehydrogenase [Methylonatrum kenyense]MCK8515275.1 NAD(P)-dependent glycerol-3-phosphate dehydrogenase [Methylonatrum kenyense]
MTATQQPIAVLGAGSWGTALALVLARNGNAVRLWGHVPSHMDTLARDQENRRYLPGVRFPDTLEPTDDLRQAINGVRDILIVVPSLAFRDILQQLQPILMPDARLIWATKGLDADSGGLLHDVVQENAPGHPMAVLSGPSFAAEVAARKPTAVTIASTDPDFADDMVERFYSEDFRPYSSSDMIGVELGGAVKNVLAIATGIADGMELGANTRAGLITRGLTELARLGDSLNADPLTFMGLSGMGDLILTCTDNQSRNRRVGLAMGRGQTLERAVAEIGQTVEGMYTAREVRKLAQRHDVEMPICDQVYRIMVQGLQPAEAVRALMQRAPRGESPLAPG